MPDGPDPSQPGWAAPTPPSPRPRPPPPTPQPAAPPARPHRPPTGPPAGRPPPPGDPTASPPPPLALGARRRCSASIVVLGDRRHGAVRHQGQAADRRRQRLPARPRRRRLDSRLRRSCARSIKTTFDGRRASRRCSACGFLDDYERQPVRRRPRRRPRHGRASTPTGTGDTDYFELTAPQGGRRLAGLPRRDDSGLRRTSAVELGEVARRG